MRAALVFLLGCGGLGAPAPDAADDVTDAPEEPATDDASPDAARDVALEAREAGYCIGLPDAACTCNPQPCNGHIDTVLRAATETCLQMVGWTCGSTEVTFDASGCAVVFAYNGAGRPSDAFIACFESLVASQRWPCVAGQTIETLVDSCTVN